MPTDIKFDRPTNYDARGRNGFLQCYGVQLHNMVSTGNGEYDEIHIYPIGISGKASEACRIPIRKSAIPALISALLDMVGPPAAEELMRHSADLDP